MCFLVLCGVWLFFEVFIVLVVVGGPLWFLEVLGNSKWFFVLGGSW